jgi:putative heme-binding domain-containing protein
LSADEAGREVLRKHLTDAELRVRAACLTALVHVGDDKVDLSAIAAADRSVGMRALAVRSLVSRGKEASRFVNADRPAELRLEAIASLTRKTDIPRLLALLADKDPFLRNATVHRLSQSPDLLSLMETRPIANAQQRVGFLLAQRASGSLAGLKLIPRFLADTDEDVRFLAVKWISDQKLEQYRDLLVQAMKNKAMNIRMFLACSTALARIDNREVNETQLADYFFGRLTDKASAPAVRVMALQLIPRTHAKQTVDLLSQLLHDPDPALQLEAVRALSEHPSAKRWPILAAAARNRKLSDDVRAQALVGLAGQAEERIAELIQFAEGTNAVLRDEALRGLTGVKLTGSQRQKLEKIAASRTASGALAARVLGKPFVKDRPAADNLNGWLEHLEGAADAAAGRRVLFHPKLGGCYLCHRVEGRGREIGPDLSTVGRAGRKHILESILQPSTLIAPNYQSWDIETKDGKKYTGMLVKTDLDVYTYLDAKGNLFKLSTPAIAESRPSPVSIMPAGLADLLTDQEMRDLLAYLCARR